MSCVWCQNRTTVEQSNELPIAHYPRTLNEPPNPTQNSADDLIGFALLAVAPLLAAAAAGPQSFDMPLRKNGLAKGRGRVRGKVRVEWPGEGEVFREERRKRQLPKAAQLVRECCVVS